MIGRFKFYEILFRVQWKTATDVSKDHTASTFRVKQSTFLALPRAEGESKTIIRNVGDYSPVYPAHRPRRSESATINLSIHYVVLYFNSATWLGFPVGTRFSARPDRPWGPSSPLLNW